MMNRVSLCFIALLCAAPVDTLLAQAPCSSIDGRYHTDSILKAMVTPPRDPTNPNRQLVLLVSHRGNWQYFPENSIEAIRRAAEDRIEIIEIDVRLSQDAVPYLSHDYILDRSTTGTGDITQRSSADLGALKLRDRFGTPTNSPLPSFASLLGYYYNEFTCLDGGSQLRGPVLVVDVKGGHGSTTYLNLKPVVDVSRQVSGVPAGLGLVFKVKSKDLPANPADLEQHLGWSATVRDEGQNLMIILNPDDPTLATDPKTDPKFTAYLNKPYVIGFEVSQWYKGDKLEPYFEYLRTEAVAPPQLGGQSPRTVMMYLQDNFLPEGVTKSDATCCYMANTDRTAVPANGPLDYRGRIELFGGRADLLTADRLDDVINYLRATARRDTTFLY